MSEKERLMKLVDKMPPNLVHKLLVIAWASYPGETDTNEETKKE